MNNKRLRNSILSLSLSLSCVVSHSKAEGLSYKELQVSGRSSAKIEVDLSASDRLWLSRKKRIVLGTSYPDYPPLNMSVNGVLYEGITADYAVLIAKMLNVDIVVRQYRSRDAAIQALKLGEVDILGGANNYDAAYSDVVLSNSYLNDQPVLFTRVGESHLVDSKLEGKRVAMLNHYLPLEAVCRFYPKSKLELFTSTSNAIGAVVFGQADVYLGDIVSSSYLASNSFFKDIESAGFSKMKVSNFSFALLRGSERLKRLVDRALKAIPLNEKMLIIRRWDHNGVYFFGDQRIELSAIEREWLGKHPIVNVAVDAGNAPFLFKKDGLVQGVSKDLLNEVSFKTGIKFKFVSVDSWEDVLQSLESGRVDLIGAESSDEKRELNRIFSRPYLVDPLVLVSNVSNVNIRTLEGLLGRTVASVRHRAAVEYVKNKYPGIKFVEVASTAEAFSLVVQKKVDAAIDYRMAADYKISNSYKGELKVVTVLGEGPESIAFAMSDKSKILGSILDKVIVSLPASKINSIIDYWVADSRRDSGFWERYRKLIIELIFLFGLLLAISIAWAVYFRCQVIRRIAVEKELCDQLKLMQDLIDGTPNPIYVRDRAGRLVICNMSYLESLSVDRTNVVGRRLTEVTGVNKEEAAKYEADYKRVMKDQVPLVSDRSIYVPTKDQVLDIYQWILPYHDSEGIVKGIIGGWIDITDRKKMEENLRFAKDQADLASRAKTTFLATMSHEIRTPLNAVIGMLEMSLRKADQGEFDRVALEVAYDSANGLLGLIGDILDVVRIESGLMELCPARTNLRGLIESVVGVFDGLARQKGIQLLFDTDPTLQTDVLIDALRFKQIISNLLSNAIKFTEHGKVEILLDVIPSKDKSINEICIKLTICDTGVGISAEDQLKLFSAFSQVHGSERARKDGAGLGLMISRTLCEIMGGTLILTSTLGIGTSVEISLDLTTLDPLPIVAVPDVDNKIATTQKLKVLIVDDHMANLLLLNRQLEYLGCFVSQADNAERALSIWRSSHFDVVITDCSMPNMSGYELAKAIRDDEVCRALAPCTIFGFTANAQTEEKERCLLSGMNDCLFKPISLSDLSQKLLAVQSISGSDQGEGGETAEVINLNGIKHLLSDDPGMVASLLESLASYNEKDLAILHGLTESFDYPSIVCLAHKIKGGATIVTATELIKCCQELESACAQSQSLPAVEKLILKIEEHIVAVNEVLTLTARHLRG
ncbi:MULTISPECIES: transporter substrate-binding domain-containing protein [Pseudomonas]|uniref:transporter substrate-binding domain-containing protein n=1 Tax=Pseudomonas TaxID=286 RepID=UPI000B35A85C|nr:MULTISPECIES: transporter substrate-binding domain-containing protein [Pseudomonas]PMY64839.1 two-component system sensor histidine kinase EvgS [Pseudomonas sp. FW305-25]PMY69241.1 two-component system sensor histidine kinase EvgS [Pseudomonas sp. FW126-L8]PNA80070.1 two-component system sensor histidine kinase EvgS [Pseudomonas sp. FW305-76]